AVDHRAARAQSGSSALEGGHSDKGNDQSGDRPNRDCANLHMGIISACLTRLAPPSSLSRRVLISLFIDCYNDLLCPETGKADVTVLERRGRTVEFRREQTCCGQMHYNTGYWDEAVPLVRQFVQVFRGAEVICIPSASCVAMIRDHYPRIAAEVGDHAL